MWIREGDPAPTITKTERSAGKVMYSIFFSNQGPVCQVPVPSGQNINGSYYAEAILPQVLQKWSSSQPGHRLRIHHDNAPAHRSAIVLSFWRTTTFFRCHNPLILLTWPHVIFGCSLGWRITYEEEDLSHGVLLVVQFSSTLKWSLKTIMMIALNSGPKD